MKILPSMYGLGDNIVISGAIVELAKRHGEILLTCHANNMVSVSSFYVNHPEIKVVAITPEQRLEVLEHPDAFVFDLEEFQEGESWDRFLYRILEVDLEKRWDSCPIPEAAKQVEQIEWPEGISLVHDDADRFMKIRFFPHYPISIARIENDGKSVLQYVKAIHTAPEIHCIDSSFMHLVECFQPTAKLYWHRYARVYTYLSLQEVAMRLKWEWIWDDSDPDNEYAVWARRSNFFRNVIGRDSWKTYVEPVLLSRGASLDERSFVS